MPKKVKKPVKKNPNGRPSKFGKTDISIIEKLYRRGFTDMEVAEIIGVREQTISNWKKKHPKFFESLKDWKIAADGKVEKSLYERACGYTHPEEVIKVISIGDGQGSEIERVDTIKHYAPDPTSMIFWLKNRQPKKWRDTSNIKVAGDEEGQPIEVKVKGKPMEELMQIIRSRING